jgi:hypothetical protein
MPTPDPTIAILAALLAKLRLVDVAPMQIGDGDPLAEILAALARMGEQPEARTFSADLHTLADRLASLIQASGATFSRLEFALSRAERGEITVSEAEVSEASRLRRRMLVLNTLHTGIRYGIVAISHGCIHGPLGNDTERHYLSDASAELVKAIYTALLPA